MTIQFSGSYDISSTFVQKRTHERAKEVKAALESRKDEIQALPRSAKLTYDCAPHVILWSYPKNKDRIVLSVVKPDGETHREIIEGKISNRFTTSNLVEQAINRLKAIIEVYDITR